MAQSYIQVPPNSTGEKVDTYKTATAAQHRHVMVIGDKDTDAGLAPVDATKGLAVNLQFSGALPTVTTVAAVTQITNPLPAGTNVLGHVILDSGSVTDALATSGGYDSLSFVSAASNNSTIVKATPGQVYGVHVFNFADYPVFVKLYNKATGPTPATDNALLIRRIGVQAGTQRDIPLKAGVPFSTGIGLAVVLGIADTNNTSTAASDCLVELEFK